jgi:hypothetical protein
MEATKPKYAELLRAVKDDYPSEVEFWCVSDSIWVPIGSEEAILLPRSVYRIKPNWTVPDEPDEPDELFWGEAVWQTRRTDRHLSALVYRMPDKYTDRGLTVAASVPHMKVEGWEFVGFVFGARQDGEPLGISTSAVEWDDDHRVMYAHWAVWRKA